MSLISAIAEHADLVEVDKEHTSTDNREKYQTRKCTKLVSSPEKSEFQLRRYKDGTKQISSSDIVKSLYHSKPGADARDRLDCLTMPRVDRRLKNATIRQDDG